MEARSVFHIVSPWIVDAFLELVENADVAVLAAEF
jgi:hypothetical protein